MKPDALENIEKTTDELLFLIKSTGQDHFNTIPFEGSWSVAQVVDHVMKSYEGVIAVVASPAIDTNRNEDLKVGAIKDMFLDFSIKMQSPDFVLPTDSPLVKEKVISSLEQQKDRITNLILSVDLKKTYTEFELPGFGEFTRLEWIYFLIYHMQRHIRQVKNIKEKLEISEHISDILHR